MVSLRRTAAVGCFGIVAYQIPHGLAPEIIVWYHRVIFLERRFPILLPATLGPSQSTHCPSAQARVGLDPTPGSDWRLGLKRKLIPSSQLNTAVCLSVSTQTIYIPIARPCITPPPLSPIVFRESRNWTPRSCSLYPGY